MLDLINPVIAAVRTDEEYLLATKSPVTAIFMLKAEEIASAKYVRISVNRRA